MLEATGYSYKSGAEQLHATSFLRKGYELER